MAKKKKNSFQKKKNSIQKKAAAPKANAQTKADDKTAAKKAAVLGTEKKSRLPLFAMIAGATLIMGAAYYFVPTGGQKTLAVPSQTSSVVPVSQVSQITYPVDLFADGQARHFEYKGSDATIKYFILKSSDGIIRAAYDACDVCWPAGKGYYQDGDHMVCRNCGRRFASKLVNVVQGGCNPAPLTRSIENGNLVIKVNDILNGKQYFDFSKRT
ncbi:MAG: DUF2318 domain-containing protein [Deltaproteobacteria bacterium]|nr:DUF2318 domain-containing protein [Deltaproteobacteria bacterium]